MISLAFCYPWLNMLYVPLTNPDEKENIARGPARGHLAAIVYLLITRIVKEMITNGKAY